MWKGYNLKLLEDAVKHLDRSKNRDRTSLQDLNPLPSWEGMKGRGNLHGYLSPSP